MNADAAQQLGRDPMQTLQAAASALFRQLIKPDPVQEGDEQVGPHLANLSSVSAG